MRKLSPALVVLLSALGAGVAHADDPSSLIGTWSQPVAGPVGCAEVYPERRMRVRFTPDSITLFKGSKSKSFPATYRAAADGVIVTSQGEDQLFKITPNGLVGALGPTCPMVKLP